MTPEPTVFFCVVGSKDSLSDQALTDAITLLNDQLRTRTVGPISLALEGYDEDPREIWEIPEARDYMRRLALQLHDGVAKRLDEASMIMCAVCCGYLRPVSTDPVTGAITFKPTRPT